MTQDIRKHTVQNTSDYSFSYSLIDQEHQKEKKKIERHKIQVPLEIVTPITLYKQGNQEVI